MAGVTFSEKALRLTVTLDKAGANNVYTLTGFATHVAISKQGGVDFAGCHLTRWLSSRCSPSARSVADGTCSKSKQARAGTTPWSFRAR